VFFLSLQGFLTQTIPFPPFRFHALAPSPRGRTSLSLSTSLPRSSIFLRREPGDTPLSSRRKFPPFPCWGCQATDGSFKWKVVPSSAPLPVARQAFSSSFETALELSPHGWKSTSFLLGGGLYEKAPPLRDQRNRVAFPLRRFPLLFLGLVTLPVPFPPQAALQSSLRSIIVPLSKSFPFYFGYLTFFRKQFDWVELTFSTRCGDSSPSRGIAAISFLGQSSEGLLFVIRESIPFPLFLILGEKLAFSFIRNGGAEVRVCAL